MQSLKRIILLAFFYWVFGRLALALAIPPGYATVIWPSAGIALAFTLCYGYRMWTGIFIGSFFVNIFTSFQTQSGSTVIQPALLASAIGMGAALQAVCGAFLVQRHDKSFELVKPKDIGRFFLFGGMIASMISPTCGVLVLAGNDIIAWENALTSWLTWWVGDVIGVVLFTPLLFLWIGGPRHIWQARRYFLIVPLLIIFGIVAGILNIGQSVERKRMEDIFEKRITEFTSTLAFKFKELYVVLDSLRGLYYSSEFVSRDEFKVYISNITPSFPHIKSISWVPRISAQEEEQFVQSVWEEGLLDYQIKKIPSEGGLVSNNEIDVYYPILYIEPFSGNEQILGVDNASEPIRKAALELSLKSEKYGASAPITLLQDQGTRSKSILLNTPVFTKGASQKTVLGFLTITLAVKDVIHEALKDSSLRNIKFIIVDSSSSDYPEVFSYLKAQRHFVKNLYGEKSINVAGRQWKISYYPLEGYYKELQTWTLWFIIAGAFLLAVLLNVLLLIITGQTVEVQREVGLRTNELKKEIIKNENIANELRRRSNDLENSRLAALNIMEDALEAQKKAEQAEESAQKALNVKSDFTSMVSHELRTPLTVIKESVAIVYDGTAGSITDDQKEFLETAKRNVDRLGRLINDVLDYQKLDAQRMEFRISKGDINEVVQECGESFRTSLTNKGLGLDIKLAPDLPAINFDKDKIIQVMVNLINNAMKFSEKGRVVLMTERSGDNAIKVSVKDSGFGIKEEDKDKLFKSFSQISTGSSRQPGGTGLGLALCKKIIESHKGKIDVDSVFNEGSVFYFILPITERRRKT